MSESVGTSVGFNESQGFDASVSETTTISNSKTTTVPAISIFNGADFGSGDTGWNYKVNDLREGGGALDLINQRIWQLPFSAYNNSRQGELVINCAANLSATLSKRRNDVDINISFSPLVPWPFGTTFAIQPPAVTGISPSCVNSGDQFTIQGTGLYPSLVQAVLIGGTPVTPVEHYHDKRQTDQRDRSGHLCVSRNGLRCGRADDGGNLQHQFQHHNQ